MFFVQCLSWIIISFGYQIGFNVILIPLNLVAKCWTMSALVWQLIWHWTWPTSLWTLTITTCCLAIVKPLFSNVKHLDRTLLPQAHRTWPMANNRGTSGSWIALAHKRKLHRLNQLQQLSTKIKLCKNLFSNDQIQHCRLLFLVFHSNCCNHFDSIISDV